MTHLDNNRVTFTTETEVDYLWATMEDVDPEVKVYEETVFLNINETRDVSGAYNTTPNSEVAGANSVARLSSNGTTNLVFGPAKSLRVQKGDKVSLEVMASYEINSGTATGLSANLSAMALDAFNVNPALEVIKANAIQAFFDPKALLSDDGNGIPHAYLNYILFDENYIPRGSGAVRVSDAAENDLSGGQQSYNHEQLTFGGPIDIDYNGYMYIYVSNESNWEVQVYFDDLKIEHEHSKIIQQEDFYAFGLTFNQTPGRDLNNKYLYNSFELQDDLGLGWYDYQARYYDPALGRFNSVDPAADLMRRLSIYSYAFDNPIRFIDPDGMDPDDVIIRISREAIGTTQIRLIGSEYVSGAPKTIEVPVYLMTVTDDVTGTVSEYNVTRDGPVINSDNPVNEEGWWSALGLGDDTYNVDNTAFEPASSEGDYIGVPLAYPEGSGLEAYNLRNPDGSDDLATDPERGTSTADGVMIHVGGTYTNNGSRRITGSLGCFGLCGKDEGNQGAKRFINDVVTRREKNRAAGAGTEINITVEKRQSVDWHWEVDEQGKKQ